MKTLKILIIIGFFAAPAFSQQISIFSLYHENGYILNPAITGSENAGILAFSYRHQWTEIADAPRTISLGYRMPIYSKGDQFQRSDNFIGVGGYVMNDKTGPTSYLQGGATFAYHISFAKINPFHWAAFLRRSHLSIGITASVNQYRLNSTELIPDQANDELVLGADDGKILPNAGLGAFYYYDKFYLGFSAPQVIPWNVTYADDQGEAAQEKEIHYFLVVGGKIPFGEKQANRKVRGYVHNFYLEPQIWFKRVQGAPYQYDFYARFRHKQIFWAGVGYRSSKTIVMDAGFMVKKAFKVGYSYDLSFSDISSYLGGTHEFIIAYHFDLGPKYRR